METPTMSPGNVSNIQVTLINQQLDGVERQVEQLHNTLNALNKRFAKFVKEKAPNYEMYGQN